MKMVSKEVAKLTSSKLVMQCLRHRQNISDTTQSNQQSSVERAALKRRCGTYIGASPYKVVHGVPLHIPGWRVGEDKGCNMPPRSLTLLWNGFNISSISACAKLSFFVACNF